MKNDMTGALKQKRRFSMPPMLFVLLGFLAIMFIGAFLLSLPVSNANGKWLSFPHSFFTSASAVCVTGLIVRPTAVAFSGFGQAVLLLLIQIGGLGFMTLTTLVFILIGKRITLKDRIALREVLGQEHIKGVVRLVRNIAIMTVVIELGGALLLIPFFTVRNGAIGIWQSLFTAVSAFCNAGFDVLDKPYASLTMFNGNAGVLLIVSALITLGGLGFTVIRDVIECKFRFKKYSLHTKIVLIVSLALFLFGTFFFLGSEFNSDAYAGLNGGEKLLNSIFQSVTARTAGFNAVNQADLSVHGKVMTCVLMFIGASPGGTGGGIKTTTLALLVLMGISGLKGKDELILNKRSISFKLGMRAVAVVTIAFICIFVGEVCIALAEPQISVGDIFYEVISAFGTVGLSTGITPTLSDQSLFVLVVLMFIGRLGALSVGFMFSKPNKSTIKYPNVNLMIG